MPEADSPVNRELSSSSIRLARSQALKTPETHPKMRFKLLDKNYNYKIILNSGYDHLDGRDLYPNFEASVNASLVGNMKKKTIVRVKSTKHFCQEKAMQTCA